MKDLLIKYKLIEKGKVYSYFARSDGCIVRCLNSTYKETLVKPWAAQGRAAVKINKKERALKHIIAEAFVPGYKKGMCIENIDGDIFNCSPKNLRVYTYREHGIKTGHKARSQKLMVMSPDGKIKHYRSIREAAKGLFCSHQALRDHLRKRYKSSILDGYIFKFEE